MSLSAFDTLTELSNYRARRRIAVRLAIGVVLTIMIAGIGPALATPVAQTAAASQMTLGSSQFVNGGPLPLASTCLGLGLGHPPALQWSGVPSSAHELALLVTDPQGATGVISHWVVTAIPTTDPGSAAGKAPAGSRQGLDGFLLPLWLPPCPPPGSLHRYVFTLYAIDTHLTFLLPPTDAQVRNAMTGHILATSNLAGTFGILA
jgi:Raf kinase inhibitor-like YbhB/YbcL family protein